MLKTLIIGAALGAATFAGVANAAVNVRQINQERRIDAGKRSGKLTAREDHALKAQQASISHEEKVMRARHGGHLTAYDKARLHARQDRANRHILHDKHNRYRGKNHLKI